SRRWRSSRTEQRPTSGSAWCHLVAGIVDTPLPVLGGKSTQLLYSVPGVVTGASDLQTFFICTSTDTTSQQVGVELFPRGGGSPCNDATASALTIAPGGTAVFATGYVS